MKFLIIDTAANTGMSYSRFKELCLSPTTEEQFQIKEILGLENHIVFIPENLILEELHRHSDRKFKPQTSSSKNFDELVNLLNGRLNTDRPFRAMNSDVHDYGCYDGIFFNVVDISVPNEKFFNMVQKYSFNSVTCGDPVVWGGHPELDDISDPRLLEKHKEMFSLCGVKMNTLKIEKIESDGWNNLSASFTITTRSLHNLLQMVHYRSAPFEDGNGKYDLVKIEDTYHLKFSNTWIQDLDGNYYNIVQDEYENYSLMQVSPEDAESLCEEDIKTFNNLKLADSSEIAQIIGVSINNINLVRK